MAEWLDSQWGSLPADQREHFSELSNQLKERLWHQAGLKLLSFVTHPFFSQPQSKYLLNIYQNVLSKFGNKIKTLDLAQFAVAASRQIADPAESLSFLEAALKTVGNDEEAASVINMEVVLVKIRQGKVDECKVLLEETKTKLDSRPGILDSLIYAAYYRASLELHKVQGNAAQFFQNALLFLAYSPLQNIHVTDQVRLAADMGLAALVATNVYNFGELLQHPIIQTLKGTDFEWLSNLLFAFNEGNITAYQRIAEEKAVTQDVLTKNAPFLNQKIRIMALMEMVFRRPSDNRTISFEEISKTCSLPVNEVELLLMKAFSLKVVKGIIDQVDQNVRIKWVQPRVLDKQQIGTMRDRIVEWSKEADQMALYLEQNAPELIHRS